MSVADFPEPKLTLGEKVWTFFPTLGRFVIRWSYTRNYRLLWRAVPAMLIALLVFLGLFIRPFYDDDAKARHYREAAQKALMHETYKTASLYFNRLQQLDALDDDTRFRAALVRQRANDIHGARAMMQKLAPLEDKRGHGPAHLWIAQFVASGQANLPPRDTRRLVETHLQHAISANPEDVAARFMLATYYSDLEQFDRAEEQLKQLMELRPDLRLAMVELYARQGKVEQTRKQAQLLVTYFSRSDDLSPASYAAWAEAYATLDDYENAERVMKKAVRELPNDENLNQALSRVYTTWAAHLGQAEDTAESLGQRIGLLDKAVTLTPADPAPWAAIAHLTRHEGKTAEHARALLNPILADGTAPATVHMILGTIAAEVENYKLAKVHLEQAVALHPAGAVALNNLAWVLGLEGSADNLKRARELSNQAVERQPASAPFRETRGQILVKLEQWSDAVTDLELALAGMDKKANMGFDY